jgi:hypothetical protein
VDDTDSADTENNNPIAMLPDTYSRRKRLSSGLHDPLRYDEIPHKVRMQVMHIFNEAVDLDRLTTGTRADAVFDGMVAFFRRELGVGALGRGHRSEQEFTDWFLSNPNLDETIDALEMMCRVIERMAARSAYKHEQLEDLLAEINARLMEGSIGFQFENDQVVEATSKYLHSELVVPALELLGDAKFEAANSEFMSAHAAFREQDYEQCLVECCKAFESVIKVIAAERKWVVPKDAQARTLVKAVFDNGLIPNFLESEFAGIRTVLENGVNTVRNKSGGHGAGTQKRVVPRHLAAFQLHQTGAAITLLAEAHAATPVTTPAT